MDSLHLETLVLNKGWDAFNIETAKESIVKTFTGDANVLDENYVQYGWEDWLELSKMDNEGPFVRTSKIRIKVPRVIRLLKYNRIPKIEVKLTRRNLFIRDKLCCQYTNKKLSFKDATIDHVIPRSKGGKSTWDNMVICSLEINIKKGNRTPKEAGLTLIRQPKQPTWNLMFVKYVPKIPRIWEKYIHTDQWNEIGYWDVALID